MMWILFVFIGIAAAIYLLKAVPVWVLVYKIQRDNIKQEAEREAERKKNYERHERHQAERQEKIDYMKSLGLVPVSGVDNELWIVRENNKIKELVGLNGARRPLAELIRSPAAETIGIDPVLYYNGEKIDRWQMLDDEAEIRKLNNDGM